MAPFVQHGSCWSPPRLLGQGPPKVDWAAELYVLNGGWLSLGVGVVERVGKELPQEELLLSLITKPVTYRCRERIWWDMETQRLSSPPPWFKGKESTAPEN